MANLNVTYQDLQDVAKQLDSGRGELIGQLDRLKGAVDGLIGAGFQTDNASGVFQTTYGDFHKGVSDTVNALTGLQTFLTKAAEAYQQTDQELANALR